MVIINNIQIDSIGPTEELLAKTWVVYSIEFSYNFKAMIRITTEESVEDNLRDLMYIIQNSNNVPLEIKISLFSSSRITLNIEYEIPSTEAFWDYKWATLLLVNKYSLIEKNKTYAPFGLNDLTYESSYHGNPLERMYARDLNYRLAQKAGENIPPYTSVILTTKGRSTKKIYQYDKETGKFVQEFPSASVAARTLGVNPSNIALALNGSIHSAGGYLWSYNKFDTIEVPEKVSRNFKKVYQYDKETGEFIRMFNSYAEAAKATGISNAHIRSAAIGLTKSIGGYFWALEPASNYKNIDKAKKNYGKK